MELQYKNLLTKYKVNEAQLPEDAKEGIAEIKNVIRGINLIKTKSEKAGKEYKVRADVTRRLARLDRWVCGEIIDYINDTDENADEAPEDADDILKQAEKDAAKAATEGKSDKTEANDNTPAADPKGLKIDKELKALFDAGKTSLTIDEIRSSARNAYDVIFETYERDGDNGVATSYYSLIEQQDGDYSLTSK